MTPKERLAAALKKHELSIWSEFIPFHASRNYKPEPNFHELKLNWRVHVMHRAREIYVCNYSAGVASCPSYKPVYGRISKDLYDACLKECETGRRYRGRFPSVERILPDEDDVFYSLLSESTAMDYPSFESWAEEFGLDSDSRKNEAEYKECLACGLALNAALGHKALDELREAAQDY
jgi:hypothetical protein